MVGAAVARRVAIFAAMLAVFFGGQAGAEGPHMFFDDLRKAYRHEEPYVHPGRAEFMSAQQVFRRVFDGAAIDRAVLKDAGLEVIRGSGGLGLSDRREAPAGRGFYGIRPEGRGILISAPHQYRDLGTGRIAALIMDEMPFRAFATNTVPRDLAVKDGFGRSDLAHLPGTHFNAFHAAFYRANPHGRIVQIHGFAQEKRKSQRGREADVILSSGFPVVPEGVREIAECLSAMGLTTLVYPEDIQELGGTTNANLAAVRDAGAPVGFFIHVELAAGLRERLRKDRDVRWIFATCLEAGLAQP